MNADYLSAGSQGGCGGVNLTPAFNGTIKVHDPRSHMHKALDMSLTIDKHSTEEQILILFKCLRQSIDLGDFPSEAVRSCVFSRLDWRTNGSIYGISQSHFSEPARARRTSFNRWLFVERIWHNGVSVICIFSLFICFMWLGQSKLMNVTIIILIIMM